MIKLEKSTLDDPYIYQNTFKSLVYGSLNNAWIVDDQLRQMIGSFNAINDDE